MKVEKTPEEAARSKRAHADSMIAMGAVTTVCALAAAWIAMSGRGDVPDWMFGGRRAERAAAGAWANVPSAVRFSDWGPEPFARAKKEGKLVLLFLGPSFNAPTARMEAETFGDVSVAALVAARFVPVRVKSEDYPDLDRRYRDGGWPTTAALLPDGVPLAAGTTMTPDVFKRWAGALADKAAVHPEILARVDAEAAQRRKALDAANEVSAVPMDAAEADRRAQAALYAQWDPSRRTFDRIGPRFPRFERIAALRGLKALWAADLAQEAAKGALIFQDPKDGGFRRAANPDGSPAALETLASDQAASLDALCGAMPDSARKELRFIEKSFEAQPHAWLGWRAGYAVSKDRASDLPGFDGVRLTGPARLGEGAELSRAVISCAEASPAQKAFARRALERSWTDFARRAKARDPRLLLGDAVGLGRTLLAAGRTNDALAVRRWMDRSLSVGPAYFDRPATGVLPADMDRVADPDLNARALVFLRGLGRDKREKDLYAWLSVRSDSLDPAVWAALAVAR